MFVLKARFSIIPAKNKKAHRASNKACINVPILARRQSLRQTRMDFSFFANAEATFVADLLTQKQMICFSKSRKNEGELRLFVQTCLVEQRLSKSLFAWRETCKHEETVCKIKPH